MAYSVQSVNQSDCSICRSILSRIPIISNRSQMMFKCDNRNKKVTHKIIAQCVLTTFWHHLTKTFSFSCSLAAQIVFTGG